MGTQKNHLNEIEEIELWVRNYSQFYAENFCLSKLLYTYYYVLLEVIELDQHKSQQMHGRNLQLLVLDEF